MFEIRALTLPTPAFARFTYPRYRPIMTDGPKAAAGAGTPRRINAIGAFAGETPVGLALVGHEAKTFGEPDPHARLHSIMVAKATRRRGVGTSLLRAAEALAREAGARRIVAYHSIRTRDRGGFEVFLARAGWAPPVLAEFRLAGEANWTERLPQSWTPMLNRLEGLGYSADSWERVTAADREEMTGLGAARRFDFRLYEPHSDPAISLILRRHGAPVGWIFGETRPGEGLHHYTNGWVIPGLQALGWVIAGLYDVCRRQAQTYGPKSVAVYETVGENERMIAFMKRRLTPVTLWMDERYESRRSLDTD
jgi:GNAT superfamily N-acetyltransferase